MSDLGKSIAEFNPENVALIIKGRSDAMKVKLEKYMAEMKADRQELKDEIVNHATSFGELKSENEGDLDTIVERLNLLTEHLEPRDMDGRIIIAEIKMTLGMEKKVGGNESDMWNDLVSSLGGNEVPGLHDLASGIKDMMSHLLEKDKEIEIESVDPD